MCVLHVVLILTFESFFYIFGGLSLDKHYTSVHPLSNTNLIYIYMFILLYANCVVMYCVSFDVVVGNKLYLILSYLRLYIIIQGQCFLEPPLHTYHNTLAMA